MKVIATKQGFYGIVRRREGEVFDIPDQPRRKPQEKEKRIPACVEAMDKAGTVPETFSSLWMRRAPSKAAARAAQGPNQAISRETQSIIEGDTAAAGAYTGSTDGADGDESVI